MFVNSLEDIVFDSCLDGILVANQGDFFINDPECEIEVDFEDYENEQERPEDLIDDVFSYAGINRAYLEHVDSGLRRAILEDAGLDADEFDYEY
ncbi:hypothetical protein [Butyrivibrio sp. VCD2006]|uniref:hypothetical protein n=1 Tax=Butyrivibrio sp. VCD2006 TaxID=1280664 RepID=UPI00041E92CE|nr:hypothetical protein [Butyrivibrio sp. VCD2006]